MPSLNIHRNDTVKVLTGSDRGKTGRVLRVFPDKGTVLVEHVRVVKKTVSSKQGQRTKGGIAEQESPINVSNVHAGLPQLRPGARGLQGGRRHQGRVCKKCGQTLPTKK
jgi:large subunit ribosomal protein L24